MNKSNTTQQIPTDGKAMTTGSRKGRKTEANAAEPRPVRKRRTPAPKTEQEFLRREYPGNLSITVPRGFDIQLHNRDTMLYNNLMLLPDAQQHPEDYVFCAGVGEWPAFWHGIEILVDESGAGLLLAPRKLVGIRPVKF